MEKGRETVRQRGRERGREMDRERESEREEEEGGRGRKRVGGYCKSDVNL